MGFQFEKDQILYLIEYTIDDIIAQFFKDDLRKYDSMSERNYI